MNPADIRNNAERTVTSWNDRALYEKGNVVLLGTVLRILGPSIINPYYVETWYENVNNQIICYSMSRLNILKNFGWVFFDKIVNKNNKTLPDSTLPCEKKETVPEEDPFGSLLLLSYEDSNENPPKTPSEKTPFSICDLCIGDTEEPNITPKKPSTEDDDPVLYLALGDQETQPNTPTRIETSEKDFLNALAYLNDNPVSKPVVRKEGNRNEEADLLELLSI